MYGKHVEQIDFFISTLAPDIAFVKLYQFLAIIRVVKLYDIPRQPRFEHRRPNRTRLVGDDSGTLYVMGRKRVSTPPTR